MHSTALWFQAWEAWEAGRLTEEFDLSSKYDESHGMEIRRWVQVGLLCIQEDRKDRPTIADVLEMLNGKKELPTPKKIAYVISDEGKSDEWKSDEGEADEEGSVCSDGSLSPVSPR